MNGQRLPLKRTGARSLEGSLRSTLPGSTTSSSSSAAGRRPGAPRCRCDRGRHCPHGAAHRASTRSSRPGEETLALKFDVNDDYGIAALALVFRTPGNPKEQRVKLTHDEGRSSKGQYKWDVAGLKLQPGQSIAYFLEALDNDTVKGPKKGLSRTQTVKLYSAAEHRRAAVKAVEELWERLVVHLADRMEGPDRDSAHQSAETLKAGAGIDERGGMVAGDGLALAGKLLLEPDAPLELAEALRHASPQLLPAPASPAAARRIA